MELEEARLDLGAILCTSSPLMCHVTTLRYWALPFLCESIQRLGLSESGRTAKLPLPASQLAR